MTVQPASSAGATLLAMMPGVPFQGMMAPTTPTGSRSTKASAAPDCEGCRSWKG